MSIIPLCKVISTRSNHIDYRPRAHHQLFLKNDHFDYLFNAYLRCETFLQDWLDKVMIDHHKYLIDGLIKDYNRNNNKINNNNNKNKSIVSISCINTGLSDLDRDYLIDRIINRLEKELMISIAESQCNSFDSARDILIDICCQYYYKQTRVIETEKRRASSKTQGIIKLKSNDFLTKIKDKPLESLQELKDIKKVINNENKVLIILLRHCERIDPEVFGVFIKTISSYNGMKCHIIAFNSSICPNPIPLEKSTRILMDLSLHKTVGPFEIYDDFMGRIVAARKIPISFPASVIAWIHESFWRSNSCSCSVLDKILVCLSTHFQKRCSILCMYEDREWLQDMKLINKGKDNSKDPKIMKTRIISSLLSYLGAEDLIGTGLKLATIGVKREQEVTDTMNLLTASITQAKIDHCLFNCLKIIRDTFLERDRRIEFSADIIYAAIITNVKGETQCNLLDDLITAITQNLSKESVISMKHLLQNLFKLIDSLLHDDDIVANNFIKDIINDIYEELKNNILMIEEIIDIFQQCQLPEKVSLNYLKKHSKLDSEGALLLSSSKIDNSTSLNNISLLENFLNDLVNWIKDTLLKIQLIPRPALIPSIIDMSEEAVNQALKAVNSNIRLNTLKATLNPNDHIPKQYNCKKGQEGPLVLPEPVDVSIVASLALNCVGTESLFDWYDEFNKKKRLWNYEEKLINSIAQLENDENNDNKKDGKKRSRSEIEIEMGKKETFIHNLDATARSRFMTSVNMLETIGLIKSKPTSYLVSRSMYAFTEEE